MKRLSEATRPFAFGPLRSLLLLPPLEEGWDEGQPGAAQSRGRVAGSAKPRAGRREAQGRGQVGSCAPVPRSPLRCDYPAVLGARGRAQNSPLCPLCGQRCSDKAPDVALGRCATHGPLRSSAPHSRAAAHPPAALRDTSVPCGGNKTNAPERCGGARCHSKHAARPRLCAAPGRPLSPEGRGSKADSRARSAFHASRVARSAVE